MNKQVKKGFDTYFTSRNLPSADAKQRMLHYRTKRKKYDWLPATLGIILITCVLLFVNMPVNEAEKVVSANEVEAQLKQYMTEEEIKQYTYILEVEESIELVLLEAHPLSTEEIKQLKEMGVHVTQRFVWPRFPMLVTLPLLVGLLVILGAWLFTRENKRLRAYTPLILSLFSTGYCGLGIYMSQGFEGIVYVLLVMFVTPVMVILSVLWVVRWEWQRKKEDDI